MRIAWVIVTVIGIAGIFGIVYVASTPGDQALIGGAAGIAAMVPVCAAMGWWAGSHIASR